jgi:acyl-CoA thioesterase FadM
VWSAVEAIRKATGKAPVILEVEDRRGEAILLRDADRPDAPSVLTVPVKLTLGPPRMIALTVAPRPVEAVSPGLTGGIDPACHCVRVTDDGPRGQPVQELRFVVSFREASGISRRVAAPRYLDWMGKMRELVTSYNVPRLIDLITTGEWGLVTNWGDVRVFGEATANDVMRMRFWTDAPRGSEVQFSCEFSKILPSGRVEPVALGTQKATWVRLVGHGQVVPEPLPEDLAAFVRSMGPREDALVEGRPEPTGAIEDLDMGPVLHQAHVGPAAGRPLRSETFQTTLEEANLVGNVYFANYFSWQERVRDLFLHAVAPEAHLGVGAFGELVTRHMRVDYLREAMPFDRVQVELRLSVLHRQGAVFGFEYFRLGPDGRRQKLSVGTQEVAWVRRSAGRRPHAEPWPEAVCQALLQSTSLKGPHDPLALGRARAEAI